MKISPAIFFGAGELVDPLIGMIEDRIGRVHQGEPWLQMVHRLHLGPGGEVLHRPLAPGCRPVTDQVIAGLSPALSLKERFELLMGPAGEQLGQDVLLNVFHELLRTDLAKDLSRQGHQLERDLTVFVIAAAFDPGSSAAVIPLMWAVNRLYATGMIQDRPEVQIFALLPDLFPERNTPENWARTFEFFRELQALDLDARLTGIPSRLLDIEHHAYVFGRGLSNGLAIPSWESCAPPIADFISLQTRGIVRINPTNLDHFEGKPARMNAFGCFRFFYPAAEVDEHLRGLVRHRYAQRFVDDTRQIKDEELIDGLMAFGRESGLDGAAVEAELKKAAGVEGEGEIRMPPLRAESFADLGSGAGQTRLSRALQQAAQQYEEIKKNQLADEEQALRKSHQEVVDAKLASLDELVRSRFWHRANALPEQVSLERGPRLLKLLLNYPLGTGKAAAPAVESALEQIGLATLPGHCLDAWEKDSLQLREDLLGMGRKSQELQSAETRHRDSISAVASMRLRLEEIGEQRGKLERERLDKLLELDSKIAELAGKLDEIAAKNAPATERAPAASRFEIKPSGSSGGGSGSITDRLWGSRGASSPASAAASPSSGSASSTSASPSGSSNSADGSLASKLWGSSAPARIERSPKSEPKEAKAADPPTPAPGPETPSPPPEGETPAPGEKTPEQELSEIRKVKEQYYARPSAREIELDVQYKGMRAQLERLEKEIPEHERRLEAMRAELQTYRERILEEPLQHRRLADLEDKMARKVEGLEAEIKELAKSQARRAAMAARQRGPLPGRAWLEIIGIPLVLAVAVWLYFSMMVPGPLSMMDVAAALGFFSVVAVYGLRLYRWFGGRSESAPAETTPDLSRLAGLLGQVTAGYQKLIDARRRLTLNRLVLETFARVRWHAGATHDQLEEFKKQFVIDSPLPPLLQVDETPWEISLAPPDLSEHLDRHYGAALDERLQEVTGADRMWAYFKAFENSREAAPIDADVESCRDRAFKREREDLHLADRIIGRLGDSYFRERFNRLVSNLGVGATINEETCGGSSVRKTNYLALRAPEKTSAALLQAIKSASGLDLIRLDSDDDSAMTILVHWCNWAAFQLTPMVKARDSLHRLIGGGSEKGAFSALPEALYRKLPEIFPLQELMNAGELAFRELAVAALALGWVRADFDRAEFGPAVAELDLPVIFGWADYVVHLASAPAAAPRALLQEWWNQVLFGKGPDQDALRRDALARIDALCRDYENQTALFHVIEGHDFEILRKLPEKLIQV